MQSSVESYNNPEADETCKKSRLMLASLATLWLFSLGSPFLDHVDRQWGWLCFTMPLQVVVCLNHTPCFLAGDQSSWLIPTVLYLPTCAHQQAHFPNRIFFFPLSKACIGYFSLGIDSEVMYGKSYLNIYIWLENTLVLEHYSGRLSEKRVFAGTDPVTVILNYRKAGRVVCEADKPWLYSHVKDFSITWDDLDHLRSAFINVQV